ncbi:MAG: dihydrofolate reductase [Rubrivivax sp.]|nr:dihydrofolate reductase [Rubrivivax sp.]
MADTARPTLALIAAVARNGAIGKGNDLLLVDAVDQRHFRETTMGCPVIMGRRTWESLPARFRPLPGRRNLVLSRDPALALAGAEVAASLPAALARCVAAARVFVIGGAEVYAAALPLAQELVLTEIDADLEGDTWFPVFDRAAFDVTEERRVIGASGLPLRFVTYRRRA